MTRLQMEMGASVPMLLGNPDAEVEAGSGTTLTPSQEVGGMDALLIPTVMEAVDDTGTRVQGQFEAQLA
ncbi:MAG: hypothetical protein F4X84_07495 [Synechococcus sp. SB0662_bin_45]|nr:hypothetical protein [Synechococcus sp. SB0668_bin_13]MYE22172.1 hypothetical protein [Synechococcus sp. SB0662_bin_45]